MSEVSEQFRESKESFAQVFRNASLRRLNLALIGSVIGDWAFMVAFGVYVYQQGGATALGILGVVRYVVMALGAPFAAALADKFDRRRLMIASDLARALLVTVSTVIVVVDGPPIVVYAMAILSGMVSLVFRPAQAAMLPSLARNPSELTAANVAASGINSIGFFIGPLIGGGLLAVADLWVVFLFNVVSFVWSALMLSMLRPAATATPRATSAAGQAESEEGAGEPSPAVAEPAPGFIKGAMEGFRLVAADPDLRRIITLYTVQTVAAGASVVYEVAIALELLDIGESGVGLVASALGVGGVIGGAIALVLAQRGKLALDFGAGVILWGAPLLLVAAFPSIWAALTAMALIGIGNSIVDVNAETIIQRLVPDEVLGRVFGTLDASALAGMAIGAGLMPLLISTMGLRAGLVVLGGGITAIVLVSIGGLNRIDRVALAPVGLEIIKLVPMLGVLPESVIERLARRSGVVTVPAGDHVFQAGDPGDLFYIIVAGEAEVSKGGTIVNRLGVGDSFGEIALLRDVPRTASVVAATDLELRTIERRHFLPAVTGHTGANEQAELVVGRLLATV